MGGEPAGEIVDLVVAAADEAGHRAMQARLGFGEAIASARDIGRQYLGPQAGRCEIEPLPCRP